MEQFHLLYQNQVCSKPKNEKKYSTFYSKPAYKQFYSDYEIKIDTQNRIIYDSAGSNMIKQPEVRAYFKEDHSDINIENPIVLNRKLD